ncbi:MAG: Tex-like N-terminal domain-containing protein [Kofleriaceae bacterium]
MSEPVVPAVDEAAPRPVVAPPVAPDLDVITAVARELRLTRPAVAAACALLDDGATVPFIARYRKERTGGLDEVALRAIVERRAYREELGQRREAIRAELLAQGQLSSTLAAALAAATTKAELEDLYAPFRPRRRTRAQAARERGLGPLAERILAQPLDGDPAAEAAAHVDAARGVASVDDALAGARDIVADVVADTASVRGYLRGLYGEHGEVVSTVVPGKDAEPTKFEHYYAFRERAKAIPSHRFLAIQRQRGRRASCRRR